MEDNFSQTPSIIPTCLPVTKNTWKYFLKKKNNISLIDIVYDIRSHLFTTLRKQRSDVLCQWLR